MSTERIAHSGALCITGSDANGNLVTRVYYGYSKREAERMFRAELRHA